MAKTDPSEQRSSAPRTGDAPVPPVAAQPSKPPNCVVVSDFKFTRNGSLLSFSAGQLIDGEKEPKMIVDLKLAGADLVEVSSGPPPARPPVTELMSRQAFRVVKQARVYVNGILVTFQAGKKLCVGIDSPALRAMVASSFELDPAGECSCDRCDPKPRPNTTPSAPPQAPAREVLATRLDRIKAIAKRANVPVATAEAAYEGKVTHPDDRSKLMLAASELDLEMRVGAEHVSGA